MNKTIIIGGGVFFIIVIVIVIVIIYNKKGTTPSTTIPPSTTSTTSTIIPPSTTPDDISYDFTVQEQPYLALLGDSPLTPLSTPSSYVVPVANEIPATSKDIVENKTTLADNVGSASTNSTNAALDVTTKLSEMGATIIKLNSDIINYNSVVSSSSPANAQAIQTTITSQQIATTESAPKLIAANLELQLAKEELKQVKTQSSPSPTGTQSSPSPTGTQSSPSPTGTQSSPSPSDLSSSVQKKVTTSIELKTAQTKVAQAESVVLEVKKETNKAALVLVQNAIEPAKEKEKTAVTALTTATTVATKSVETSTQVSKQAQQVVSELPKLSTAVQTATTPAAKQIAQQDLDYAINSALSALSASEVTSNAAIKALQEEARLQAVATSATNERVALETAAAFKKIENSIDDLEGLYNQAVTAANDAVTACITANYALLEAYVADQESTLEIITLLQQIQSNQMNVYNTDVQSINDITPNNINELYTNNNNIINGAIPSLKLQFSDVLNQLTGISNNNEIIMRFKDGQKERSCTYLKTLGDSYTSCITRETEFNKNQGRAAAFMTSPESRCQTMTNMFGKNDNKNLPLEYRENDKLLAKNSTDAKILYKNLEGPYQSLLKNIDTINLNLTAVGNKISIINGTIGPAPLDLTTIPKDPNGQLYDAIIQTKNIKNTLDSIKNYVSTLNSMDKTIQLLADNINTKENKDYLKEAEITSSDLNKLTGRSALYLSKGQQIQTDEKSRINNYQTYTLEQSRTKINYIYNEYNNAKTNFQTGNINEIIKNIKTTYNTYISNILKKIKTDYAEYILWYITCHGAHLNSTGGFGGMGSIKFYEDIRDERMK